ncbi:MAG TPA: hypothetical protein VKU00_09860, partial [Chthonomonadaceae bacterium]|nr:hypothetical protein [Chthonomonadaceae bacterium]
MTHMEQTGNPLPSAFKPQSAPLNKKWATNGNVCGPRMLASQIRYNSSMTAAHIKDVLNRLANLPAPVRKWEVDTGPDATGENAVWIWAVMDDANL